MTSFKRGISVVTFNRGFQIAEILEAVLTTKPNNCIVNLCDDGSNDGTLDIITKEFKTRINYYGGVNKGVSANKNRALFAMKDCHFACIIEDDIKPTQAGWFEIYEKFCLATDIHHIARVQDKVVEADLPEFIKYCKETLNLTPRFGSSPRGDISFFTKKLIKTIGGLSPKFRGVGFGHGQWSLRAQKAGLCGSNQYPWVDVVEANEMFTQLGDTAGGRWDESPDKIKAEIAANREVRDSIGTKDLYCPIELP